MPFLVRKGRSLDAGKRSFFPHSVVTWNAAGLALVIAQVLRLAQPQAEIEMFFAVAHGVFYCPGLAATLGKLE